MQPWRRFSGSNKPKCVMRNFISIENDDDAFGLTLLYAGTIVLIVLIIVLLHPVTGFTKLISSFHSLHAFTHCSDFQSFLWVAWMDEWFSKNGGCLPHFRWCVLLYVLPPNNVYLCVCVAFFFYFHMLVTCKLYRL